MQNYLRPTQLQQALAALAKSHYTILAGGTDFYPTKVAKPLDEMILDISAIESLRGITDQDHYYRIGALSTWTDLMEKNLPAYFDGLKLAAREIGGVQIQNAGTICGNICNASPAADGVPNLLTLDAQVELSSVNGTRLLPLSEFIIGNRQTVKRADEMVIALQIPKMNDQARSIFLKLGARRYLVISIVMVAVVLIPDENHHIADSRISVGACSAVAQRLYDLEKMLQGKQINIDLLELIDKKYLASLNPIDDMRGSADYRMDAALTLVKRAVDQLSEAMS